MGAVQLAWHWFAPVSVNAPFPVHVDFVGDDGMLVLASARRAGVRDVYDVSIQSMGRARLDLRLAMAMSLAIDALQGR